MELQDLTLSQISIGDKASFSRTWTNEDVKNFAELSGDKSPLHTDDDYASTTKFGKRLVHGMLVGTMCSTLVGMYLPGKKCLYVSQSLTFRLPVFIGDTVTIIGEVISKSSLTGILEIAISIQKEESEIVSGVATVQVREE